MVALLTVNEFISFQYELLIYHRGITCKVKDFPFTIMTISFCQKRFVLISQYCFFVHFLHRKKNSIMSTFPS